MRLRTVIPLLVVVMLVGLSPTALPGHGESKQTSDKSSLSALEHKVTRMSRRVREYERTQRHMERWWRCIRPLRVDRAGDPEHGWGFEYDERDGTGVDTRTALVRRDHRGRPDLLLLRFRRSGGCVSAAPDPNGTGEDARATPRAAGGAWARLRRLERRLERLKHRIERVEDAFDRFDEWESCLSWLPVTEFGHAHQELGYLYGRGAGSPTYLGAIDIDETEWDDPDYELLAFIGRDRPWTHRECGHEPGEDVDRSASPVQGRPAGVRGSGDWSDRLDDVRSDIHAVSEDVEDLLEPVQEFVQFDECMFTVGVRNLGTASTGYRFQSRTGARLQRSALSFDMTGLKLPQWDVMAFPGEEPPQIECNEDAGGQNTDE